MDILTIVAVGAVLLLVGVFTVRKLKARTAIAPARATPSIAPPVRVPERERMAAATPVAPRVNDEAVEVERLKLKLINCFGGNAGAMSRSITFEQKKFSHLSEAELLKKMLYDFGRGH
jgi:hypothetical protein